jgi:hypothetical protein
LAARKENIGSCGGSFVAVKITLKTVKRTLADVAGAWTTVGGRKFGSYRENKAVIKEIIHFLL